MHLYTIGIPASTQASFENLFSLSSWLILHSMRKCLSSSKTWQEEQLRSPNFRLRASISSVFNCQGMRTGSQLRHGDSIFIILDSIQIWITVNVLNLLCPYIDEPFRENPFAFRFELRWWTINIKKICIDQFANMSNPCREVQPVHFSQLIIHWLDNSIIRHTMKTIDIARSRHTTVYTRWQDSTFLIYHNIASSSFHIANASTETLHDFISHQYSVLFVTPKRHCRKSTKVLLLY